MLRTGPPLWGVDFIPVYTFIFDFVRSLMIVTSSVLYSLTFYIEVISRVEFSEAKSILLKCWHLSILEMLWELLSQSLAHHRHHPS